ncbi:hypothetical protein OMEGA_47 [Klebsiella phage vB_KaeM_KaOmega]|nr:hypothetical protein OMEGA_47 [Klebsiella phage vB_KaeM_KaOmega]
MIGFFEFLIQNAEFILVFVIAGALFGFVQGLGESWKYKLAGVGVGVIFWGFLLSPLIIRMDYSDYKRHYATCEKYEAKQAGYIFSDDRCYKPIAKDVYVKVNETTKTKQELLDAK